MTDTEIASPEDLLAFWLSEPINAKWFAPDADFDAELGRRFGALLAKAKRGELAHWGKTPDGALALIILLDQMPRNIHRGSPDAFAADPLALAAAKAAIAQGFDLGAAADRRLFFYLPFEHAENLADQDEGVALFEALGVAEWLDYMRRHREIIARFGRFPHRNDILGRNSTPEEIEFLKLPGSRF